MVNFKKTNKLTQKTTATMPATRRSFSEEFLQEVYFFLVGMVTIQKVTTREKKIAAQHFGLPIRLISDWVRRWKARASADHAFFV